MKRIMLSFVMFILAAITDCLIITKAGTDANMTNFKTPVRIVVDDIIYKNVKGTVYHAVPEQTDSSPLYTADNSFINVKKVNSLRWVALSRDLMNREFTDRKGKKHVWKGQFKFGDTLWIAYDTIKLKKMCFKKRGVFNEKQYKSLIKRHEKISGYWIVKDVMGSHYYKKNKCGEFILDKTGQKIKVNIVNSVDFLQDNKTGVLDMWNKSLIITKKRISYNYI